MRRRFAWIVAVAAALLPPLGVAQAQTAQPPTASWIETAMIRIEAEAVADAAALPAIPHALSREWRSFNSKGSALGALGDLGWIVLVAAVALVLEKAAARGASRRLVRRMRAAADGPGMFGLLGLIVTDMIGLAVFVAVWGAGKRHLLDAAGISTGFAMLAMGVLVRWRLSVLVVGAILRPREPIARLVEVSDAEAGRLSRFLSMTILLMIVLVGFGRYGLMDEDSGAAHVIGLVNALIVGGLYLLIVFRAREATEALIRGRRSSGVMATLRAGLAQAWIGFAVTLVGALALFFIAGLSLGLLDYYHALVSTLGISFVALVADRLTEKAWHDADPAANPRFIDPDHLRARTLHHILRALGLGIAAIALVWVWTDAIDMNMAATLRSASAAIATLFIAFVAWELVRLGIDRHLQGGGGPAFPGPDSEDELAAPASRLQTILPLLRAAFGVLIGVLAALIVLSRLGVDTAPLIAGAGVFGLAVSFGSQSLVRDIISGLFYMWDDAFRVGEYIDMGRLKGTVETLGIRSVKLRHQNGPLHTIPYGQLGAVTNLSRDFATIKFNLRFEQGTDIEAVRKATKQIGLSMQDDNAELAAEVMLPLKLQGIAEVVDNAVVLRFKFTARPVKPSWVQREYLKRMYQVFAEQRIQFATGTTLVLQHMPTAPASDPGQAAATGLATIAAVELAEAAVIPSAAG